MAGPSVRFNQRWIRTIADAWRSAVAGTDPDPALAAEVAGQAVVAAIIGAFRVYLDRETDLRRLVDAALDRIEPALA